MFYCINILQQNNNKYPFFVLHLFFLDSKIMEYEDNMCIDISYVVAVMLFMYLCEWDDETRWVSRHSISRYG